MEDKTMEAVTYTTARQNMAKMMDEVCANSEVKIITRTNNPSVVMMSLDDYNSFMETAYLLSNSANANHLRNSINEAKQGKVCKVELSRI